MKKRLDVYLVENNFAGGRDAAKRLIEEGVVFVNGKTAAKAGMDVEGAAVEVRGEGLKYVSRGGLKLEKAIDTFGIDLKGMTAVDVGASSGGFTDCMLQNGAAKVYAVDVGHGQLAQKLAEDERVVNCEGTDVRRLSLEEKADFVSVDVAFISLTLVLPYVKNLLKEGGGLAALIKPQFEAGRGNVGKKGVVRDSKVHREVVERIVSFAADCGFDVEGLDFSPIKGPEGNIEYLMYAVNRPSNGVKPEIWNKIAGLVQESHSPGDQRRLSNGAE